MAVYERTYSRYKGPLTPTSTRFLILPKYAFKEVFASKWMLAFLILCFMFPLWCCAVIYLSNNADFLALFPNLDITQFLTIDADFFFTFLQVQAWYAFFLSLFIGPGLVSRDLSNNGLPLYLSRPFSRVEYVVGKTTVLAVVLSAITWVVGMLLVTMQASFVGWAWLADNLRLVFGMFVGSWIWILTLSLMSLAISAWVRWRPVAAFAMFLVLLGGLFFGSTINLLFRTEVGDLVNLIKVIFVLWAGLLGVDSGLETSVFSASVVLLLYWGVFLFMLNRKIRAYEVVS